MTREILRDIKDYLDVKSRFVNSSAVWFEQNKDLLEDKSTNPLNEVGGFQSFLNPDPLIFDTKEKFDEYVNDPRYENDEAFPGMCLAILVEENISDP